MSFNYQLNKMKRSELLIVASTYLAAYDALKDTTKAVLADVHLLNEQCRESSSDDVKPVAECVTKVLAHCEELSTSNGNWSDMDNNSGLSVDLNEEMYKKANMYIEKWNWTKVKDFYVCSHCEGFVKQIDKLKANLAKKFSPLQQVSSQHTASQSQQPGSSQQASSSQQSGTNTSLINIPHKSNVRIAASPHACQLPNSTPVFGDDSKWCISDWLFVIENSFKSSCVPDHLKVSVIAPFLRGTAFQILKRFVSERNEDWDDLSLELLATFQSPDHVRMLRSKLLNLKHDGSFQKYSTQFQMLSTQLSNMSDIEKLTCFLQGLKHRTRTYIILKGVTC